MNKRNYRSNESKPLKDLINTLFKSYGLEKKMHEMDLLQAWPDLMGPAVAHRTTEIKLKNNVLVLKIESSVMREELLFGKQIIIDRLNDYAGKEIVKDIWFS
jgi:hypothetical protein